MKHNLQNQLCNDWPHMDVDELLHTNVGHSARSDISSRDKTLPSHNQLWTWQKPERLGLMELKVAQGVGRMWEHGPTFTDFSNLLLHCTWDCQSTSVSVTLLLVLYCCWVAFPSSLQYLIGHHFRILWKSPEVAHSYMVNKALLNLWINLWINLSICQKYYSCKHKA